MSGVARARLGRGSFRAIALCACVWVSGCGGRAAWSDRDDGVFPDDNGVPDDGLPDDGTGGTPDEPVEELPPRGGTSALDWQLLFSPERDPSSLAADERFVYWVSPDVRGREYRLRAAPLGGGRRLTLYTGNPGLRYLLPVADGEYVYFEEEGRIARVQRTSPGSDQTLVSGDGLAGFAVDGEVLYWVQSDGVDVYAGQLYRTFLGLDRTELVAIGLQAAQRIAVAGDYVYYASERRACPGDPGLSNRATECVGGGVHRVLKNGGTSEVVHPGSGAPDLVVNDSGIYWLDPERERLLFAPFGGAEEEVAHVATIEGLFAHDDSALYWANSDRVTRLAFGGGAFSGLAGDVDRATSVAVSSGWIYVGESGTDSISRAPIDAPDLR